MEDLILFKVIMQIIQIIKTTHALTGFEQKKLKQKWFEQCTHYALKVQMDDISRGIISNMYETVKFSEEAQCKEGFNIIY